MKLKPHTYVTFIRTPVYRRTSGGGGAEIELGRCELDGGFLMIREGKFRKSRRLPLHPSTIEALTHYISQRREAGSSCLRSRPRLYS